MPFWGKKKEEALGAPQQENAGAESNVMGTEGGSGGALSALRENIKQKQGNAYYYAHATRDTGEAPAPRRLLCGPNLQASISSASCFRITSDMIPRCLLRPSPSPGPAD